MFPRYLHSDILVYIPLFNVAAELSTVIHIVSINICPISCPIA
ncbi:hypothetical protein [Methanobrevibacter smithii]|nr:hypothetical protein [Methanobrevibacter smithii]